MKAVLLLSIILANFYCGAEAECLVINLPECLTDRKDGVTKHIMEELEDLNMGPVLEELYNKCERWGLSIDECRKAILKEILNHLH